MIYVDSSVLLAQLLSEDICPPASLWDGELVSSRLIEYETWTVLHNRKLAISQEKTATALLDRLRFIELSPIVLERCLDSWPLRIRTLDAIHLASLLYLQSRRVRLKLATYDNRMEEAAGKLKIKTFSLVD